MHPIRLESPQEIFNNRFKDHPDTFISPLRQRCHIVTFCSNGHPEQFDKEFVSFTVSSYCIRSKFFSLSFLLFSEY